MSLRECLLRSFSPARFTAIVLIGCFALTSCFNSQQAKQQHLARGEEYLKERKYHEATMEFRSALEIDKSSAEGHWGLARTYEGLVRIAETIEELEEVVKLDKANLEARSKLGNYMLLVRPPQISEAERLMNEIFALNANYIEGHILKASILTVQNKPEKDILAVLEYAVSLDPKRVETYLSIARFYKSRNNTAKADETFQRALKINDKSPLAYMEYGRFLNVSDRANDAEKQFMKAVESEPANREAHEALAGFYFSRKQFDKAEQAYRALADLDKDKPEGQAVLADFYAAIGKTGEAIKLYQEIVAAAPHYARGRYRLGELLLQKNDLAGVKEQIDALLNQNDQDTQALLLRARVNLEEGESENAIKDLEAVLKQERSSRLALYYMADARLQAGQIEQARAYIGDLERYHPDYLFTRLLNVQISIAANEPSTALRQATEFLNVSEKASPASDISAQQLAVFRTNVLTARGFANLQLGKSNEANADLQTAKKIAPNQVNVYRNLARLAKALSNEGDAVQFYEKILALENNNVDALNGLVEAQIRQKQFAAAHQRINATLAGANDRLQTTLYFLRAQVLTAENKLAEAEAELKKAIDSNNDYLPAYSSYAALLVSQNQSDRAIEQYKLALQKKPDAGILTLIGMIEEERGNLDEAISSYREALKFNQRTLIAANNLAWLIAENDKGSLDEALQLAQTAVEKAPNEPGFIDTLGWVFHKKGLVNPAIEQLKRAVALDEAQSERQSKRPNALYRLHLGLALAASGDKNNARREVESALRDERNLTREDAQKARNFLNSL
jgi:tetratricopeptide (TPR) repeat protein